MILISFLLWQIPNIMIPCMILVGHHLNSVLKEVFFLVGCLRRVVVETNVYWAWVLYLSHLIQMKILRPLLQTHNPLSKTLESWFQKGNLVHYLTPPAKTGAAPPNQPHSHVCSKTYDSHTNWGKVSLLCTYEKYLYTVFRAFCIFELWIR